MIKRALIILSFVVPSLLALAQPTPPPGGGTGAPIDNDVAILILMVAFYGYWRIRQQEETTISI